MSLHLYVSGFSTTQSNAVLFRFPTGGQSSQDSSAGGQLLMSGATASSVYDEDTSEGTSDDESSESADIQYHILEAALGHVVSTPRNDLPRLDTITLNQPNEVPAILMYAKFRSNLLGGESAHSRAPTRWLLPRSLDEIEGTSEPWS